MPQSVYSKRVINHSKVFQQETANKTKVRKEWKKSVEKKQQDRFEPNLRQKNSKRPTKSFERSTKICEKRQQIRFDTNPVWLKPSTKRVVKDRQKSFERSTKNLREKGLSQSSTKWQRQIPFKFKWYLFHCRYVFLCGYP